ncbi:MAG: transcriptional regulator, partial [Clostridiales bacterium]
MEISAVLNILADENRLRILNMINEGEACVGEISTILGLARPN